MTPTVGLLERGPAVYRCRPSKGVIANDTNVLRRKILAGPTTAGNTVVLNPDGTFTYTSASGGYLRLVHLLRQRIGHRRCLFFGHHGDCDIWTRRTLESAGGIRCTDPSFTSKLATFIRIPNPGPPGGCVDAAGYPLTVVASSIKPSTGLTVVADQAGGFTGSVASRRTLHFHLLGAERPGHPDCLPATATITFPAGSGLAVNLVDGKTGAVDVSGGDYRWIIEEDRSFYVNPSCTANIGKVSTTNPAPAGCAGTQLPGGTVPILGTNFHTSDMPFVAQGCTGPISCESGQTLLGAPAVCDVGDGVCRTTASQKTIVLPERRGSGSNQALLHLRVAGQRGQSLHLRERLRLHLSHSGQLRLLHGWRPHRSRSDCSQCDRRAGSVPAGETVGERIRG